MCVPTHSCTKEQQRKCRGPEAAYCASWGCESTGWITWTPLLLGDLITIASAGDMRALGTGVCTIGQQQVDCGPCYEKEHFPKHPRATSRGAATLESSNSLTKERKQTGQLVRLGD